MDHYQVRGYRKLVRWRLRFSEFEFDIVHRTGIKHQYADTLPNLMTRDEDKTALDIEYSVLTVSQAFFACSPQTEITDLEFVGEPKRTFVLFTPKLSIVPGITESS